MTAIYSVGPRSSGPGSQTTQPLLQNSYFIAAVAIVLALIILRIIILRWRRQTLSDFFRIGSTSSQYTYGTHPPDDTNYGSMYHGLQLAPVPAAYRPDRRIRGADTDAYGRRLDSTGENWNGKDALPVYDNFDRPPKYVEAGWTHGEPSMPMEQSAVVSSPEGEQSRMAHSNTANEAPVYSVDQPSYYTRTLADVAHETEAPPPPIHHDLSSS